MIFSSQQHKFQILLESIQLLFAYFSPKKNNQMQDLQKMEPTRTQLSTTQTSISDLYKKQNSELEFVSQYLSQKPKIDQSMIQNACIDQVAPEDINLSSKSFDQQLQNQKNRQGTKKTRSIFQNFQKHLITTLKLNISLNKNIKNDPTIHLADRMWRTFLNTRYFSKKILYFLFGVKHSDPTSKAHEIYKSFHQIATVYPQGEIELAQQYLRQQIRRQGRKLLSSHLLSNRRIQRSEQFLKYFQNFLEEMQNGGLSKRLPKSTKINFLISDKEIKQSF